MRCCLIILIFLVFAQCKNLVEDTVECPTLELAQASYTTHVHPLISKTCAIPQCHTVDFAYGNFNEFDDVKLRADNGKLKFMIDSRQMPHGFTEGPVYLNNCEIEIIKKWINEGANNN